jgi:hypothetical protein
MTRLFTLALASICFLGVSCAQMTKKSDCKTCDSKSKACCDSHSKAKGKTDACCATPGKAHKH